MNRSVVGNVAAAPDVAQRIRRLREQQRMSQQALAEASGLSRNTLSLLERGRTSPTLATLQKIAAALGVDINLFFQYDGRQGPAGEAVLQARGAPRESGGEGDCRIEPLIAAHILRMAPESSSGSLPAHCGEELIYCLRGQCLYAVGEQQYLLRPGDSLHIDGRLPHCCHNPSREKAEALVILLDLER